MDIKSKLNILSCTFKDESLEDEYQSHEWQSNRTKLNFKLFALLILAILIIILEYGVEKQWIASGQDYPPHIQFISYYLRGSQLIHISLYVFTFFLSDIKKRKHGNNIVAFTMINNILAANFRAIFSPASRFQLETMGMYFYPAYPIFLAIIVLAIIKVRFNYLFLIFILTLIPAMYPFIVKGNAPIHQAIIFVVFPACYILFNVYQDKIKSRVSFYYENLMGKGLRKYFGDNLTDKLIEDEGKISGQVQWVTISFTDMVDYSTIVEKMSPELAVDFLNEYYNAVHNVILDHNGMVLNYVGDSVMVIYGAPYKQENHEIMAVNASIKIRDEIKKLNDKWNENNFSRFWRNRGIDEVSCRTGIHCGNLIVGNIGSDHLIQYSAIGDAVNIASRLEVINKDFGTNIAMSEEIYASLTDEFADKAKLEGELTLKGRSNKTNVYSI